MTHPAADAPREMEGEFIKVACGGGRNSAMLLGMYEHGIKPDVITFADTKGEKPETYSAVEKLSAWCMTHLGIPITTVTKRSMYDSLEDQCLRTGTLPSAAYGFRSCSDKWKIQPQDRFMNNYAPALEWWASGRKVVTAIGYDAGESRRGSGLVEDAKYKYWFPLVEWGWFLEDCVEAFGRHGLPVPPKSACFYCPSSTKVEVLRLSRENPELFARAVAMEKTAHPGLVTISGLGRHWSWEKLVEVDAMQQKLFPDPAPMNCVCFDLED